MINLRYPQVKGRHPSALLPSLRSGQAGQASDVPYDANDDRPVRTPPVVVRRVVGVGRVSAAQPDSSMNTDNVIRQDVASCYATLNKR